MSAEFIVNTAIDFSQWRPKIAALPDGGFVAAWASNGVFIGDWVLRAQVFDFLLAGFLLVGAFLFCCLALGRFFIQARLGFGSGWLRLRPRSLCVARILIAGLSQQRSITAHAVQPIPVAAQGNPSTHVVEQVHA